MERGIAPRECLHHRGEVRLPEVFERGQCYRGSQAPEPDRNKEPRMHARLIKPLRNLVVLLSSFFLLAVG